MAFTLLDPSFTSFFNVDIHFMNSMSILVELLCNSFYVDHAHLIFNLSWAVSYCIFIWALVGSLTIPKWTYPFLDTSSPLSFPWYTGVVLVEIILWFVWYGFFLLKMRIRTSLAPPRPAHARPLAHAHHDNI